MTSTRRLRRVRGVTLVELLVAMGLGLFLVGVMGTIFLGSKGTFQSQNHVARLQESARFSVDTLSADLRMAGFQGCRGLGLTTPMLNTLNTPTAFLYNFAQGVWASRHNGSAWGPALASTLTSLSPAPDSAGDVLTVRRAVGTGWSLTAEMGSATAALNVTSTGRITTGDLLMVSDCAGAAVFQATNATPGVSGSIEHSASVTATPGVSTNSLGRPFLQDAVVYRLGTVTYYLAPSQRTGKTTQRALWSFTSPVYDGTVQPQELVTGVERFRVTLGLDSNGDGAADAYAAPAAVTDWARVVTVQTELLLASTEDGISSSVQPYTFDGTTVTPTDRRLRTVVSLTAQVRNALR
ncbi:PilW family protein [Sphaerotilus montanus]|jgi:type IV pilus assembly protein PilW|uniref:Type IV pilus assembly protein PilW n=1 Tax=Sphaerotilus montanus TaxID=522889 RepID=A0A7Y9U804_9BURK|nr:PilW family protein [Sphaerotilus montanus]NYG34061.1 type IV pilus assembly protein PilW [Sphaerotilus montanus]NZD57703.1 PilW family protein [Sphaerotilus montanus]